MVEHHVAKIDGTPFHYVTAGTVAPVLRIPGWPESWIGWRKLCLCWRAPATALSHSTLEVSVKADLKLGPRHVDTDVRCGLA